MSVHARNYDIPLTSRSSDGRHNEQDGAERQAGGQAERQSRNEAKTGPSSLPHAGRMSNGSRHAARKVRGEAGVCLSPSLPPPPHASLNIALLGSPRWLVPRPHAGLLHASFLINLLNFFYQCLPQPSSFQSTLHFPVYP